MKKLLLLATISTLGLSACASRDLQEKQIFYFGDYKPLQKKVFVLDKNPNVEIFFKGDTISGSSGVNYFFGNFFVPTTQRIKINVNGTTRKMGDPKSMAFEDKFLKDIHGTNYYELKGDKLTIGKMKFTRDKTKSDLIDIDPK